MNVVLFVLMLMTINMMMKQDDVGMTVVTGIDTDIGHGDLLS